MGIRAPEHVRVAKAQAKALVGIGRIAASGETQGGLAPIIPQTRGSGRHSGRSGESGMTYRDPLEGEPEYGAQRR